MLNASRIILKKFFSFILSALRDFIGLLPIDSLAASTLLGRLAVYFQPDLGFSAFLLIVYLPCGLKFVYLTIDLAFVGIIVKLNFLKNFACTVLNDIVSK